MDKTIIDTADRKTENCSEKPNNSTISKMEQVDKDKPQTEMPEYEAWKEPFETDCSWK